MAQRPYARGLCVASCLVALSVPVGRGQEKTDYLGTLRSDFAPSDAWSSQCKLTKLPKDASASLPEPLRPGDEAFVGTAIWIYHPPARVSEAARKAFQVLLIERHALPPVAWVDGNGSGTMDEGERYSFSSVKGPNGPRYRAIAWRGPYAGRFRRYPLLLLYTAPESQGDAGRTLEIAYDTVAEAQVDIAGHSTLVQVGVSSDDGGRIRLDREPHVFVGVDEDGDGNVGTSPGSAEFVWAAPEEDVVFQAAGRYLSIKRIDESTGLVTLQERAPSEYVRIPLRQGIEIPDFTFTDFSGAPRRLSAFRGTYVLLDFWGTWCGPCVGQLPELRTLYERFHAAGLEIIGMDGEQPSDTPEQLAAGLAKAKALVSDRGVSWPQATTASIADLTHRRLRITTWPTLLLLDREGRLAWMAIGSRPAWGEELEPTLARLLGARNELLSRRSSADLSLESVLRVVTTRLRGEQS